MFKVKELLRFHVEQSITSLFKRFLSLVEDLREEHSSRFQKLRDALPEDQRHLVDLSDYFDEGKYNYFRKKILDIGNDAKRNVQQTFDNYDAIESL